MSAAWWIPLITFVMLALLERVAHTLPRGASERADHLLNLTGLAIQGIAVPTAGYALALVFSQQFPQSAGVLPLGWWGAFLLNFVFIDFLYYWQHRLFHAMPALWALHQCHHASRHVDIWASARNSLWINFLFVYLLVSPILAFLCDSPEGFFTAAAITAALDLWRHSRLPARFAPALLAAVLITPPQHHVHHSPEGQHSNFGANLSIWDRLFGTWQAASSYPTNYGVTRAPSAWQQFFYPW